MRTLTEDQKRYIVENYSKSIAESMLSEEVAEKVLAYIARAEEAGIYLSYPQAFWNNVAVMVYDKDGEQRTFGMWSFTDEAAPLRSKDAEGDWQSWLKQADLVIKVKGWKCWK